MTDNVIKVEFRTRNPIETKEMLEAIADDNPKNAFVIAWPADGSMPTYHASTGDMLVVLMRVQEFIHKFYNGDFNDRSRV